MSDKDLYYPGEEEDITKCFGLILSFTNDIIINQIGGCSVEVGWKYSDIISKLYNLSNSDIKRNNFFICGYPLKQGQLVSINDFVCVNNRMGLLIRKNKKSSDSYRFIYI